MKNPTVYILASKKNGTLYIGVTSDPVKRIHEHKNRVIDGFTKRYNCTLLVYYEQHATMESAIVREKQLKERSRKTKIMLIERTNLQWDDLYRNIL